jgi:glycosyltransferase involved in cell wall biosynthesis
MKFIVGFPSVDNKVNVNVMHSILNQLEFITYEHHAFQCNSVTNTLIHNARNQIALYALENNYDYLFFVDSDCVIPNGTLKRLFEHDKDIVAGMYFQKKQPFLPVIYTQNKKGTFDVITDYPEKTLFEVGGVGMGVCLIKTSVLKKLGKDPFEPFAATPSCPAINGEDLAFCKRAKARGFKIFCDTSIQAAHCTERYITEEYHKRAWAEVLKGEQQKLKAQPHAEV